jgi:hypothetical protein
MPERRLVAVFELETAGAVQNLEALTAAEKTMNEGGVTAAKSFTSLFEQIENGSSKAFSRLNSGNSVSESSLKQLAAQFVAVREAVNQAFPENVPAEFQAALKISEEQIIAVNTAVATMGTSVNDAADRFKKIGSEAAEATGKAKSGAAEASGAFAELAAAAARISTPLPEVKRGLQDIGTSGKNMAESLENAWAIDEAGGRLSARQIGVVVQNRVRLRESIDATKFATQEEAATAAQVYAAMDAETQRLIVHAQELHEAQESATVGMKDSNEQMFMAGMLAQQIAKNFGSAGEAIGDAAGELGMLSMMANQSRKAFEGMKLNELGGSASKTAIQVAAITAALALATSTGWKFAALNERVKETEDDLTNSLMKQGGWWDKFKVGWGEIFAILEALNSRLIDSGGALIDLMDSLKTGDMDTFRAAVDRLHKSTEGLTDEIAANIEAQNRRRESSLHAAAASDVEASALHKVTTALHDSLGANKTLDAATRARLETVAHLGEQLNKSIVTTQNATKAAKDHAEAGKGEAAGEKGVADAAAELIKAMVASTVAKGDNRTEIGKLVDALRHELEASKDLTEAGREYVKGLIEQAQKIDATTKAEEHAAEVKKLLKGTTDDLIAAINEQTGALEAQQTPIEKVIAARREELATNTQLTAADKARIEQAIAIAEKIDVLQKKEAALTGTTKDAVAVNKDLVSSQHEITDSYTRQSESVAEVGDSFYQAAVAQHELNDQLDRNHGLLDEQAASEQKLVSVRNEAAEQLKRQIEEQKQQLLAMQQQATANQAIKTSVQEVTGAWENGRLVISNVSKDAALLTDNVTKAGDAEKAAAAKVAADKEFWDGFDAAIKAAGGTTLPKFSEEITVTAGKVQQTGKQMADHAAEVMKAHDAYKTMATDSLPAVNKGLDEYLAKVNAATEATGRLNHAVTELSQGGPS